MAAEASAVSDIAGRYATALFELAQEQRAVDPVTRDLDAIHRMLDESADLRRLVLSPTLSREQQSQALAAVLEQARIGELVRNFVGLVARNRRLFALSGMVTAYRQLLARHRGEVVAQVTSAYPLGTQHVAALKSELSAVMKTDVTVETKVDESLLGGLIVRIGSRMVDSSLRTKLQSLKFAMKGVG